MRKNSKGLKSSTGIINLNDCKEYVNIVPMKGSKLKIIRNLSNKGLNEYGNSLIDNRLSTNSNSDDAHDNSIEEESPRVLKLKLRGPILKQKVRNLSEISKN